jgi:hypothetical protein
MSNRKTQLTVTANDQIEVAAGIESAAKELAVKTHETLLEVLPPILREGESPPDLRDLGDFASRWLAWRRQRLEDAEELYAREVRGDQRLRHLRDETRQVLIDRLRVVQARVDLAVGKGQSASFAGFSKGLQEIPAPLLLRIATQAVAELRRGDFGKAQQRSQEEMDDFVDMAATLELPLAKLTEILEELRPSLRRTEGAFERKQSELALLTRDIRRVGAFLAGTYRLVGLELHADRLRPKARVAGESEEEEPTRPLAVDGAPEVEVKAAANDATPLSAAG